MNTTAPHLRHHDPLGSLRQVFRHARPTPPTVARPARRRWYAPRHDDPPGTDVNASPSDLALRAIADVHGLHR